MAKLLPLRSDRGQLVFSPSPSRALSTRHSFTRKQTGGRPRQMWLHAKRGQGLNMEELAPMIHYKVMNIRAAFKAKDPQGTGLVSNKDFRQVLNSLTSLSQNQLQTLLSEVCVEPSATVDYVHFLKRFSRGLVATRAGTGTGTSHHSSEMKHRPKNLSLPEIEKHLKQKIEGNLRTVLRAFRLFDHNREGHIEQHEFRRILDNYCVQLTNKEFQRLWHHYSPDNVARLSYELFLDKLGFGEGHNFNIAPVCTKLALSRPETRTSGRLDQKKQSRQSSCCDAPPALSHENLQTLFYDEMCMNSVPVWQALQASDTTCSGLVKQGVLKAVLSSFIFPMDLNSFQKLTSRYGVRATGLIRWKHFLGHFMSPSKEDQDTKPPSGRSSKQSDVDGQTFNFNDIYPQLKDIFYQLDLKEGGSITQADLRRLLQKPDGTHPQTPHRFLHHSRIKELFNVLDPEHTGLIQQANLERLNPSFTPAPTSNTAPTPSLDNAPEPLSISEETKDITADTEEQKTADQMETKQWADKVSSASWRTVESPLLDNLSQQLRSLQVVLEQFDPQHTGYVMQEDLTKALSCCGVADAHFNKTCTSSPLALKPVSGQRPLSSSQDRIETCYIPHIVFQRMRSRLEQHHTSLTDRIQAIIPNPETVDLTETDLKKILEDSWVILDEENFNEFAKCLGVTDGRIRLSVFQAKYEDLPSRVSTEAMGSTGDHLDSGSSNCEKKKIGPLLTSAEQCLAALKTRIKFIYGNTFAAFRLMDRKCKGMVNSHDFKVLYQSLGFFCSKAEYNKLLDRIGLRPGANLNYAEFVNVIENNGKQEAPSTNILDQLHELLASDAHYKWADMSKVLCQVDSDGHSRVDKKSLRRLLFTYALPIRHSEFDQLWSRYDAEGRGFLAVCDFLGKLGLHHEGDKLNLTVSQPDLPILSDSASLEQVKHILQENHEELSGALTNLDTRKDGTVTVEEVLSLLHGYGCYTPREHFVRHLQRLCISMNDNTKRLHYMDFLSGFVPEVEKNEPPPPGAVLQIESLDSLSPDMALAKMRERVAFSAPSLYKAFSVFDQNGKGTVTVLEFRRVLDSFCARLSEKQYRHLLTKLELDCENSTVNWKDFLKKFKISDKNLSRSTEKESIPSSLVYKEISGNTELPQQILEVASDHQIEITKELVGADVSNTVSKEHLQHLCAWHRPDLSNDQLEHMWRQMPATEQRELQCGEFEKHSARTSRTQSAPQGTSRHPASVGRPGTGSPPGSMERRLHGALRRCWKEIQRKCATEDSQQAGRISTGSFLGILQSLNISVTQEQLEDLAAKFGCVNNGCVLYHTFLQRFLLNLNPAETAKAFERLKLPLPATPLSQGVLTKDCAEVMFRTYDVVHSSWSSIRRCFLALDRGRTGSVSVQDFRKVLCRFGVTLSEDEFFHLCSYLDANATGKICYNDFLWVFLH